MPQFIYTMKGLGKVHPPDTRVLDDIWLSFYFGAKIGVLGLNGAGKSSLLKIMSGEDQSFIGEAFPGEGATIGFLHQEPQLDPNKTVLGNVEEGVSSTKALLERYDEVNEKLGEDLSPDEMEKVMDEQSKIQDKIDACNAWDLDSQLEIAMDALRLPPPDADVTKLSGGERRRVALCRLLLQSPDILLLDEPTNHLDAESVAWLERFLHEYPGTVVAVTHDRDRKSTRLNSSHTEIYTLSLHDALPISLAGRANESPRRRVRRLAGAFPARVPGHRRGGDPRSRSEEHTSELQSHRDLHSFPTRRSSDLSCWTSQRITSTPSPSPGWSVSCTSTRAPSWR